MMRAFAMADNGTRLEGLAPSPEWLLRQRQLTDVGRAGDAAREVELLEELAAAFLELDDDPGVAAGAASSSQSSVSRQSWRARQRRPCFSFQARQRRHAGSVPLWGPPVTEGSFENRSTSFSWERVDPTRGRVNTRPLTATGSSALVGLLAPLQLERLGNLPEHDPDHGHRLAGNEVLIVQRGTLSMPLRQELVLA